MNSFFALGVAAVLVEAVVSFVDNIQAKEKEWKYWFSLVVGLGVAILVAVNYNVDVFEIVGFEGELPYVGAVLTAVILARGANYVADLLLLLNDTRKKLNGGA
jgi:hypothetical protein